MFMLKSCFGRLVGLGSRRERPGRKPRARITPGTESLEGRRMLSSSTVTVQGDTLLIRGDNGWNEIVVFDDGTNAANSIRVQYDGLTMQVPSPAAIKTVRIEAYGGEDRLTYMSGLYQSPRPIVARRTVSVDLGDGVDRFSGNVYNDLARGASLDMRVRGGSGGDMIVVRAQTDVDVAAGARLNVDLRGDTGENTVGFFYKGELDGDLGLLAIGGRDRDKMMAWVDVDRGSTGRFGTLERSAELNGEEQDDQLAFYVRESGTISYNLLIKGNSGADRSRRTRNVTSTCEKDLVEPFPATAPSL